MKQLIEDYKRRLGTAEEMIATTKDSGSRNDIAKMERLKTKAANYRTFITEMERVLNGKSNEEKNDTRIKEEVVNLKDLKRGDDVTFHFVDETLKGPAFEPVSTHEGIVDIINTPKGTCVIRTGPEAVRIMNDWFLIIRRPRPLPPIPKKKKIWVKSCFDIHELNDWWNENDVEIININISAYQSPGGSRNTIVYYFEK